MHFQKMRFLWIKKCKIHNHLVFSSFMKVRDNINFVLHSALLDKIYHFTSCYWCLWKQIESLCCHGNSWSSASWTSWHWIPCKFLQKVLLLCDGFCFQVITTIIYWKNKSITSWIISFKIASPISTSILLLSCCCK